MENIIAEVIKLISGDLAKLLMLLAIFAIAKMYRDERLENRRLNRVLEEGLFNLYRQLRDELKSRLDDHRGND